jgi:thioesterase domain-containing protein
MIFQSCDGKPASHEYNVAQALKEMLAIDPDGPYFLGGFCFGSLMALELARQLMKEGKEVSFMFLVEPSQACLPKSLVPHWKPKRDNGFSNFKGFSHLSFYGKIAALRKFKRRTKKKAVNFIRQAVGSILLAAGFSLPYTFRKKYIESINIRAMRHYVPYVYPGKAVLFIGAERDDACADWNSLAGGGIEIHKISGAGHKTMREEPYIGIWAKRLGLFLVEAQKNVSGKER